MRRLLIGKKWRTGDYFCEAVDAMSYSSVFNAGLPPVSTGPQREVIRYWSRKFLQQS